MSVQSARRDKGAMAFHAGLAAEGGIARDYAHRGFAPVSRRWRGQAGEIDLIVRNGDGFIFVEVKQSRAFEDAAHSLGRAQMRRIYACAEEFLSTQPQGALTEARFDVALVNGQGAFQIIENAFGHG
ncbi:YraN family protein [uncultured Sulfitobacter sp.]|uniref:YraN family protein n=1 Tax=uncultured Sulfitobacter sp. TaxID=191468 RepID=UPI0026373BB7|nr:YraN family protein [uncultured Sulfitobacter sp.]